MMVYVSQVFHSPNSAGLVGPVSNIVYMYFERLAITAEEHVGGRSPYTSLV